jgi:hypothetical protein
LLLAKINQEHFRKIVLGLVLGVGIFMFVRSSIDLTKNL